MSTFGQMRKTKEFSAHDDEQQFVGNLAGVYVYVTSGQMRKLRNFTTHDDEQQFVGRKIGKTNTLLNKL